MNKELHFKSDIQTWETPKAFFDQLNRLFGFTLDACASSENAKVGNYYTVEQNALTQEWQGVDPFWPIALVVSMAVALVAATVVGMVVARWAGKR